MILDYIRLRIIRIANNEKERDVLSLLYITWLIIMGVFVIKVVVFDTLSDSVNNLSQIHFQPSVYHS